MAGVSLPPSSEKRREADWPGTDAELRGVAHEFWFPNISSLWKSFELGRSPQITFKIGSLGAGKTTTQVTMMLYIVIHYYAILG